MFVYGLLVKLRGYKRDEEWIDDGTLRHISHSERFLHNVVDSSNVCAEMDGNTKREIIKCAGRISCYFNAVSCGSCLGCIRDHWWGYWKSTKVWLFFDFLGIPWNQFY